jgi:MFS family permease
LNNALNNPSTIARSAPTEPFQASETYRYYAVGLLCLGHIFNHLDRQIVSVLTQPIKQAFDLSDTQLGMLGGLAFAALYTFLGVFVASLADKHNRVVIMSIAMVVWSLFTAVCGLARNFWELFFARLGVGVGEAGGSPPSYSLIADYFEQHRRATALSLYSIGVYLGQFAGLLIGGVVAHEYGWRAAFFVVGLPGVAVALLIQLTLREPPRGFSDGVVVASEPPPFWGVLRKLWARQSFRQLSLAAALHSFVGYGGSAFYAAYLMRSHGLTLKEVGLSLGLITATGGLIGAIAGGKLTDMMIKRTGDARWQFWLPCIALLINTPVWFAVFALPDKFTVMALMIPAVALGATYLAPSIAATQQLVSPRERTVSGAVFLFVLNLVGLGLGPLLAGYLSDYLNALFLRQGMAPALAVAEGLRWSLCILSVVNLWSAYHYILAARHFRQDIATRDSIA